ncbi:MAG TPA: tRNA uridine-5-carboxymethylaminomethyl(34) synthesis GTPase MnmE [Candidatus Polarisedimenticolia bacterium]|nr:tRNA uridine-5-carboxymethylaminomethyl(34) synthesis GTPase MnmE [Candidatus Polarisedimenticolia bacterium]
MREHSHPVSGGAEAPRRRRRNEAADGDTIVAISTPRGKGGIGVVRLSGGRAVQIASALFRPSRPASNRPGTAVFGRFVERSGEPIDEGYRVIFRPPRSFTGEETVELWAHGSPAVLRALVEEAVAQGARPATPGEFTMRAFLSGRIDAPQAEAVRDLIEARTVYQAKVAHEQATGRISARVDSLKDRLIDIMARLEASIEFSEEEDVGRFLPGGVLPEIEALRRDIATLAGSYERGRRVREGATVALMGAVNVGKSSLFNRLLEEERAIVTPIAGTTRDRIEETLELNGVPVALIDTAGLHAPRDEADAEAMRRSRAAIQSADLRLLVLDRSRPLSTDEETLLRAEPGAPMLIVMNKIDLPGQLDAKRIGALIGTADLLQVSARDGDGIGELRDRIAAEVTGGPAATSEQPFLTNVRHRDLLHRAGGALARCAAAARDRLGEECLVLDLKEGLDRLGEISGEVGIEGIYDRIFSRFCIGK